MVSSVAEVGFKPGVRDSFARGKRGEIAELGVPVSSLRRVDVYSIEAGRTGAGFDAACRELFADDLTQDFSLNAPLDAGGDWDWMVHVSKKPGVKDNVGETSAKALATMGAVGDGAVVWTSTKYYLSGSLARSDIEKAAREVLGYGAVEDWRIVDRRTFLSDGYKFAPPKVIIEHEPETDYLMLDLDGRELKAFVEIINKKMVADGKDKLVIRNNDEWLSYISGDRHLALNLDEMRAIRDYFLRPDVREARLAAGMHEYPSDVDIEVIAQTWSEHCKHKIFNAKVKHTEYSKDADGSSVPNSTEIDSLFKSYIRRAVEEMTGERDWIVSVLWDNSGVIEFDEGYYICFKCETHNSPSKKHPFGGAITGIVGVYRDPMGTGMGSKIVFGTYGFCTGFPFREDGFAELNKIGGKKLSLEIPPERLLEGIRAGVQDGGNKSGVPTPYGRTFFHEGFNGKPGVYVAAGGLIPKTVAGKPGYEKMVMPGDLIVMCGGRVGIDGIHGATESSMEGGKHITLDHVQMGDPYTQKKMHDFLLEARDAGLYTCIQDCGAGGLSSAVGEMGADFGRGRPEAAFGFMMELDRVPLKYQGLDPWQILLSESQERMVVSVPKEKMEQFRKLAADHDVEVSDIGEFNTSGRFHVNYKGKAVSYLDMEFLHKGVPQMELESEWTSPEDRGLAEPAIEPTKDMGALLREMLARPNIASTEYITRQFDHEVQATSVVKPLVGEKSDVNSDGVVIRPDIDSEKALAIAAGLNPDLSEIDTYDMTANALDEAIRRVLAVGGDIGRTVLNDNFCWPSPLPGKSNPDAKYKMAQLVRANRALYEMTKEFGVACISGKDSMSMDSTEVDEDGQSVRVSAPPTVQFSAVSVMDSWENAITMDAKDEGDLVCVVGITRDECGGSEFYRMRGHVGRNAPKVDAPRFRSNYEKLQKAMRAGIVKSAHGCYKGGLGVALAQTAFAGGLGMYVDLSLVQRDGVDRDDKILASESAGRLVVTIDPARKKEFDEIMRGGDYSRVGFVTSGDSLAITGLDGFAAVKENIYSLKKAWQSTFDHMNYHPERGNGGAGSAKIVEVTR
jgi:phosphoribosylformylglycinamidine synthase